MKAYLIDSPNKQIVETDWDGDYKSIRTLLHIDGPYTLVYIDATKFPDCVYVDDEGLINGNPFGWFKIDTYEGPLRGYGLVLGTTPDGESVEPRTTLEELQRRVTFYEDWELGDPENYAHTEVTSFDSAEDMLAALFGPKPNL